MQDIRDCRRRIATEAQDEEWRLGEVHALIERQRKLIEQLGSEGQDTTSAQIVFDSLCVTLSLKLQNRALLRSAFGQRKTG